VRPDGRRAVTRVPPEPSAATVSDRGCAESRNARPGATSAVAGRGGAASGSGKPGPSEPAGVRAASGRYPALWPPHTVSGQFFCNS
jgi:hypothetical protein